MTKQWTTQSRCRYGPLPLVGLIAVFLLCGCASESAAPAAGTDRSDPEAVLRAYFDAWEAGDWTAQESYMDAMYAGMVPEPLESLQIVELRELTRSETLATYYVSFEIVVEGDGRSMDTGRHYWSYELVWDGDRESWIIGAYGAG